VALAVAVATAADMEVEGRATAVLYRVDDVLVAYILHWSMSKGASIGCNCGRTGVGGDARHGFRWPTSVSPVEVKVADACCGYGGRVMRRRGALFGWRGVV
jgi:hypothetical protein